MMKILTAYDGSTDADAAIDDLVRAGLPLNGQAEVVSIADIWLPPPESIEEEEEGSEFIESIVKVYREKGERAVVEAEILARFAKDRVRAALKGWSVESFATYGSPAWEIVGEAERVDADLVIVGSQGQSSMSRFVLGSISQKVLTECRCSVRVGRGRIDVDPGPERIIIGFDGTRGAKAAVHAVASRHWHEGSEVKLVSVNEPTVPTAIGRFVAPASTFVNEINVSERVLIERAAEKALSQLRAAGLTASLDICAGNPKLILTQEAERWGADCIFMGANAWGSRLERFLLGSTSAAVAARANCSVEVVRVKPPISAEADGNETTSPNGDGR